MKRYRFFPQWEIERMEAWLSQMEADGYRLARISCLGYCYHFKPSPKKTALYFRVLRDKNRRTEYNIGHELTRQYNANEVCASIYRINTPCDLSFEKSLRLLILRSNLLLCLVIGGCLLLFPILLFAAQQYGWAILLTLPCAVGIGYHLWGLATVLRRIRAWNRGKKHRST